jgi:prolyl-tRNA synthetase
MKLSHLFTHTIRDIPADETSINAQLYIRAGYISKTMAGVYALLPLGLRVLNKIEAIVRKRMNEIGGQEVALTALHPKEWWIQSGRWSTVDILFKLTSQTNTEYALAPSHEEQVVPIARQYIHSWKDLPEYDPVRGVVPFSVYQLQTKFRDELRSKAGLMRGREFVMKDMYDFHTTEESRAAYYEAVKKAYLAVFADIGLTAYVVEASGGIFTKKMSHEFQVVCPAGEDKTLLVPGTDVACNQEVAPARVSNPAIFEEMLPRTDILLPDVVGVSALTKALGVAREKCTKTLYYTDSHDVFVVAVIRADREVNEEKLQKLHAQGELVLASAEKIKDITGSQVGYAGLIGLPAHDQIVMYVDDSCQGLYNFECGTNRTGYHSININFGRDVPEPTHFVDIKIAQAGDIHPETGLAYTMVVSAEAGNIFDLGTRYTEAFDIRYADKNNEMQYPIMGCHGLGITRTMGLAAEIFHDEKGLCLPESVAPFAYHVILHYSEKDSMEIQEKIKELGAQFYAQYPDQVLLDDRMDKKISMGTKLSDADLIGCPTQIIITTRSVEQGVIERRRRLTGVSDTVPIDQLKTLL